MKDKNGVEIRTGDIVEVAGGFFKSDNGLYFVTHSPGDAGWSGESYGLRKLKKNGELSQYKGRNIGFWPLSVTVTNIQKKYQARKWNKEHSQIEIKNNVTNKFVAQYFKDELNGRKAYGEELRREYGEQNGEYKQEMEYQKHCRDVVRYIQSKE